MTMMSQRGPRGKLHNLKYLNQAKTDFYTSFFGDNHHHHHQHQYSEGKEKEEELL